MKGRSWAAVQAWRVALGRAVLCAEAVADEEARKVALEGLPRPADHESCSVHHAYAVFIAQEVARRIRALPEAP